MLCASKEGNKGVFLFILCGLAVVLSFPGRIFAEQPRIHLGTIEIHPYASIEEKYDTNIYLETRDQEKDDWITDYRVGIAAEKPLIPERGDDCKIEAYYHADGIIYADYDELSRFDHTAHTALTCAFPNDFGVKVSEDFLKTQSPPNNERTLLMKRWWNRGKAEVNYTREKVKFAGDYTMTLNNYDDQGNLNYDDAMFSGTAGYNLDTKTWLLGELTYGNIKYDDSTTNSNSEYYRGRVGVEGDIAPKLTGMLKCGYRAQNYEDSPQDDYSGMDIYANLKYAVAQRSTLNLYGEIRPEESSYAPNNYYQINTAGIKFDHLLREHLWLNSGASWALNLYSVESTEDGKTAKRRDTLWGTDVGLKYEVKDWLFFNAGYEFKEKSSNFNKFSYHDHKILSRISAAF